MLGAAISVIEQSIFTTGLLVFLAILALGGALPSLFSQLTAGGLTAGLVLNSTFSPLLVIILSISVIVFLLTAIVGRGFVYSAEYGLYLDAWTRDRVSVGSIVRYGRRYWRRMAWTLILSNLVTWGPLAAVFISLIVSSLNVTSSGGVLGVIVSSSLFYFAAVASLILSFFTVYSYPAVIVDNTSGIGAIKNSFARASRSLGITISFVIVRDLFQFLLLLIVYLGGLALLPLSSFSAAILSFLLTPILNSTRTMIYYHARPEVPEMPFSVSDPIWSDLWRRLPRATWLKIRKGLGEVGRYLMDPRNLPFHLLSIIAFALGLFFGDFVSANGLKGYLTSVGYVPGRGNPTVVFPRVIPPVLGADIFLNNWLVSIATGLAGIGFGAPSFATILFNGFILGLLVPLSSLTMLLAAILPHGIIEIPSFVLAGSMGIKLGYASLRRLTGADRDVDDSRPAEGGADAFSDYFSRTLRQTVHVVVGLAPLFLIAGLIEADITPIIMRLFGWTF